LGERGRALLIGTPLFVPHARIAKQRAVWASPMWRFTDAGDEGVCAG
jgi:hypothetical protein